MSKRTFLFLASLFLVAGLVPSVLAQSPPESPSRRGQARAWEHATSDLPVNPRIHFGAFEHGMRFAWIDNPEPDRRCYVRLHVDAGSLMEEESERGMAHFLEHMAFNGSRSFAAGTLIEWFQAHGMAFGADTNAGTGFEETIYKLDLPDSEETTIREGLRVLRDFADGLLLEEDEVESEKGVIDGEERERDSAGYRVFVKSLELKFDGTRFPERLPIGIAAVRRKFTSESLRAFYARWYRPENLTLVLGGDLAGRDPEPLIREAFASLRLPDGEPAPKPPRGTPTYAHPVFFVREVEIPTVQIAVERLRAYEDLPDRASTRLRDLPLDFARAMLDTRYEERAKEEGASFLGAGVNDAMALRVFDGDGLVVSSEPGKWKDALTACEGELRRAVLFGFQEAELAEAQADALRGLDEAVAREATRSSLSFVEEIVAAAGSRFVPTDAASERELFRPAIEGLTVKACHEALKKAWAEGTLVLSGSGNLDLGEDPAAALRAAYEASRKVDVEPPAKIETGTWAYASDPEKAGKIRERSHVEDLDVHLVEFANGVRCNVKKTDFKEKEIVLSARLAEGGLTLAPERQALAFVADRVFDACGLGAHSVDDLRRLTAGRLVGISFGVGQDAFGFGGATTPEDLLFELELLGAYLTDPGWREEGFRRFRNVIPQIYLTLDHQPQGPMLRDFLPALYNGDPRFGMPDLESVLAVTPENLREWLGPHLANGPLEVTLIGDLDVEAAVEAAARTLGALPARRAIQTFEERRKVDGPKTGVKLARTIDSAIPKSLVVLAFPTADGIEAWRRRTQQFLGTVVDDRLRIEVREKLGAAYSPGASAVSSPVFPGDGLLFVQSMADPDKVDPLVEACLGVADKLAKDGVGAEETDRLREPILTELRQTQRTNGFWVNVLAEAQSKPSTLDDLRRLEADYRKISGKDLSELAKRYLAKERASILVVNPK